MGLKSWTINKYARYIYRHLQRDAKNAIADQNRIFSQLLAAAKNTSFGKDHGFSSIKSYADYKNQVPVKDYENIRTYIEKICKGEKDVLWRGRPKYFAKTSGTTSGVKYIPISNESMPYHIASARNAILNFQRQVNYNMFDGKMIFLSGSPVLGLHGSIKTGRLSGIVNHEIPFWAKSNQLPSYQTNCIEDWEEKLDQIVQETSTQNMSLISGIPPWVQMYYERLIEYTGKETIHEIFPNLKLFIHGGVNYKPYKRAMSKLMGADIYTLETYPASEGFIAFQNDIDDESLLLNTNAGIFYEFIPVERLDASDDNRIKLEDVEIEKDYALIINSNAGLWGYDIGDMIRFTSKDPYKIIVSGRTKHFISAFGEHVISKEVEEAMEVVSKDLDFDVIDFTVAPQVNPESGLPYHEWFVEFREIPSDIISLETRLNQEIIRQNIYYKDLIEGKVLKSLKVTALGKNAFRSYMQSIGKLGGQNKTPRLKNDRTIANELTRYKI